MSIKTKIIRLVEEKPQRMSTLKDRIGNNRKVQLAVRELLHDGEIREQNGVYYSKEEKFHTERKPDLDGAIPGTVVKLGPTFGFVTREDGKGDIFVPGRGLMGAMPGDKVLVQLFDRPRVPGSMEGEIVAVTQEQNSFVGIVTRTEEGRLALMPDRCPGTLILIKKSADGGVEPGEKAGVEILERGSRHNEHRAGVSIRFGSADSAKMCVRALLYDHGIEKRFPEKVKKEARRLEDAKVSAEEMEGRLDLRALPIFTIDSASTMDIDDAISCHKTGSGFELGVHIADVSHYVRPGTELDEEALNRGTSIYYGDKVVPMLPRQLSNGICSLNEGVNRLAFSCLMQLDEQGKLTDYRFAKTVIRSRVKGVYDEINEILDGTADAEIYAKYAAVSGQFDAMQALYRLRDELRAKRGGMEIESNECKFKFDDDGVCVDILRRDRGISERMIEEFMLLANECAANLARVEEFPLVYRVHEEPPAERVEYLQANLLACGLNPHFKKGIPTQQELGALLDETRGTNLERAVHTGVLRSMAKAKYENQPKGHFGLALEDYAHFTSPIRRYPDLAVHRILSDYLEGTAIQELREKYEDYTQKAGEQSSHREVEAMQIERSADDFYMAEYMQSHLGESYTGLIAGITPHVIFVELPNGVEGGLSVDELGCHGEPVITESVRISDPVSGRSWMLGDEVNVTVAAANVAMGRIDLVLTPEE